HGRGQINVQLESPHNPLIISAEDATLPDLMNAPSDQLGSVVILNCSEQPVRGYKISAAVGAGGRRMEAALPEIAPLSVSKVPIHIVSDAASAENRTLFVSIRNGGHHDDVAFPLRISTPQQTRK